MTEKEKIERLLFSNDPSNAELALTIATSLDIDLSDILKEVDRLYHQSVSGVPKQPKNPSIGQKIDSLFQTRYYNLPNKGLTEVPIIFRYVKKVEILAIENSQLSALPPEIGEMYQLERLRLGKNCFELFPTVVCQINSLRDLSLNFNKISIIPPEIGQMKNLRNLFLGENKISTLPIEMQQLSSLEKISLADNPLDFSRIPPALFEGDTALAKELARMKRYV